jgi:uncharacterized protein YbjT (DUF2867 family)
MADGIRGADQIEHFRSQLEIERHIDTLRLPRTYLGTVTFMDNFLDPKFGGAWTFPTVSGVMPADVPYHLLAVDGLGAAAAEVLLNPATHIGKS